MRWIVAACALAGCPRSTSGTSGTTGETGTTPPPTGLACSGDPVSYQGDVEPIFLGCGGADTCHQLTLGRPGYAIPFLVDQPTGECLDGRVRVVPGDPENSYLIDKLTDADLCAGLPMPKPIGTDPWQPLDPVELQIVYDWICQGATGE